MAETFDPAIAQRLINFLANPSPPMSPQLLPELTKRVREILAVIAHGRSNTEIADHLVLSRKTVRNHFSTIFSKLQVAGRANVIVRAREAGLTGDGERSREMR